MNRLIITGYVGGRHGEVFADASADDAAVLRATAADIAQRVHGVHTQAEVRRSGQILELSTPGFEELDGAEVEFEPVGVEEAGLTRVTVRTRPAITQTGERFLSAGLFTARATARLQKAS